MIGFGEGCLRFQDIGHERSCKPVLIRIDAQGLARRFRCKLSDDKSLAGLLEFSELLANINQDAILYLLLYT